MNYFALRHFTVILMWLYCESLYDESCFSGCFQCEPNYTVQYYRETFYTESFYTESFCSESFYILHCTIVVNHFTGSHLTASHFTVSHFTLSYFNESFYSESFNCGPHYNYSPNQISPTAQRHAD